MCRSGARHGNSDFAIFASAVLIEVYAWLDPLARWLVRRAARQLPEENRDAFTEQFMADVDAMPNSVFKLAFALRNCTLAINDICQEIARDQFESVADEFELFIGEMGRVDDILHESRDLLRRSDRSQSKLSSMLSRCSDRLQQHPHKHYAQNAIEHFRALSPPVEKQFSHYHELLERNHVVVTTFVDGVREALARAADAQLRLRNRLLDARPIDEGDLKLIASLVVRLDDINTAFDTNPLDLEPPPADMLSALEAAAEAFKVAALEVKQAEVSSKLPPSADLN
jgi:hypothetical protein